MSIMTAMEGLLDTAFKHLKGTIDDYVETLKDDLEVYADELVRRVAKAMAVGMLGATLVSAGAVFFLIGVVFSLARTLGFAEAWGIVGVAMAMVGGLLIFALSKMMAPGKRRAKISP